MQRSASKTVVSIGVLIALILVMTLIGFSYDSKLLHYGSAAALFCAFIAGMNLADHIDPRAAPAASSKPGVTDASLVTAQKKKIDWLVIGAMIAGMIGLVVAGLYYEWQRSELHLAAISYFAIFVLAARLFGKVDREPIR